MILTFMVLLDVHPFLIHLLTDTGDEETVMDLHRRVQDFDVQGWMLQQQQSPGRPIPRKHIHADTPHLHNPYAGVHYAWQLTETVDEFLTRMPPRTTDITEDTPWIFICNPYIARVEKSLAQNQHSKGNEDEAPEEEGSKTELVVEGGLERLEILSKFLEGVRKSRKVPAAQEREMNAERKKLLTIYCTWHMLPKSELARYEWREALHISRLTSVVDAILPASRGQ
ncbi:hypothetical protein NXS19_010262 [Fusarium pseudograminearum]|nr:hypothetical protein NXS19_010262 [Fusarium pseudograminearum]